MTKKIVFLLSILILLTNCFKIKSTKERYLDNIEDGIVSLYMGDKDSLKYFNKAYKLDKNNELLYEVINSQLDEEKLNKFYDSKKSESKGYYDYFKSNLIKASNLGNIEASKELYNQYFYNFEYEKAYNLLQNTKIPRIEYIYTILLNNKEKFLEIEKIYNKILKGIVTDVEYDKFKKFVVYYPIDIDKAYDALKKEIEKNDPTALYIKYLSLDKESIVAINILNDLVNKNFAPAINQYIIEKGITDPDQKLMDKIDKYAKFSYTSLLNNCVEKGNISNISNIVSKIPNTDENSLALAEFYYYYKSIDLAYSEYIRAYKYGVNLDYVVYRLENIARKLKKEKEFLNLVKDYKGENEFLIYKLQFDLAKDKVSKKEYALKIFRTNPSLAASCLLDMTKDKRKINCYTSILKIYR